MDALKLYERTQKVSNAHAGKNLRFSPEGALLVLAHQLRDVAGNAGSHRDLHTTGVEIGRMAANSSWGSSNGPLPDGTRKMRAKSSRRNAWTNC